MKFTRETSGALTIQKVSADAITINGESYSETVAVTPEAVFTGWDPKPLAELADADFEGLLKSSPELMLVGTGKTGLFPPRDLMFAFARRGIGLECMDTAAAARTFNVLATEGRQVVALLYL